MNFQIYRGVGRSYGGAERIRLCEIVQTSNVHMLHKPQELINC